MPKKKEKEDNLKGLKLFLIGLVKIISAIILFFFYIIKFIVVLFIKIINPLSPESQPKIQQSSKEKISKSEFEEFKILKNIKGNYENFDKKIINDSEIILIFGKRGSGKSSLGFRILENIYSKTKRKCFVLGISQKLLPSWIRSVNEIERVPDNGVILIDEGAVSFSSRESMSSKNKDISKLMAIARHKDLTLIFITQNTGMIDKNVLALADTLFIKEGSLLQMEMERPEVKKFYEKSNKYLSKEFSENKKKFVYTIDNDYEGILEYNLPTFWSDKLSKNKG